MKPILTTALLLAASALSASCGDNETPPPQHAAYDGGVGTAPLDTRACAETVAKLRTEN